MQVRNHPPVGLVLIMSSITVAGTIIGEMLSGVQTAPAPFLLPTTAVLVVFSAALIVFSMPGNLSGTKKALLCRTLL